uniref:Uncharacterized protein n=1 Tax=Arundo donax TaxID=35708 RepID=A0A0A9ENF1_ARUDO
MSRRDGALSVAGESLLINQCNKLKDKGFNLIHR